MRGLMAVLAVVILGGGSLDKPKPAKLDGTKWSGLVSESPSGLPISGGGAQFEIEFRGEGSARIKLPCNTAGAGYVATMRSEGQGDLRFEGFRVTRSVCPEIRIEQVVLAQLGQVRSYVIENGKLTLLLDGGGRMVWGK